MNASKKIDQGREEAIDVRKILHESMERMMHVQEVEKKQNIWAKMNTAMGRKVSESPDAAGKSTRPG